VACSCRHIDVVENRSIAFGTNILINGALLLFVAEPAFLTVACHKMKYGDKH